MEEIEGGNIKREEWLPSFNLLKYSLIFLVIIVGLYLFSSNNISGNFVNIQKTIDNFVINSGVYSWLVYIFVAILMTISPLSNSFLGLLGGYLFNPILAIVFTLIGQAVGGMINFYIGKVFSKSLMNEKKFPKISKTIKKYMNHLNFENIFILGIIPIGTANITGYVSGLSKIKLIKFLFPWILGVTTTTVVSTLMGYSAKIYKPFLSFAIIVVAVIIYFSVKFYLKKNKKLKLTYFK